MPRSRSSDDAAPGQDSFLDIVANMVGILIILVMLVGLRVKNAPLAAEMSPGEARQFDELQHAEAAESSIRKDVFKVTQEIENVRREALMRGRERDVLAAAASALEREISTRREKLDDRQQDQLALIEQVADARRRLAEFDRARSEMEEAPRPPIVLEHEHTPLSRPVDGEELHFQLRRGYLAPVPIEQALRAAEADAVRHREEILGKQRFAHEVGRVGGFRLVYLIEWDQPPPINPMLDPGSTRRELVFTGKLIPLSDTLGERADSALREGSDFRAALARCQPGRTTITLWTYPDSVDDARTLTKALHDMKLGVAVRPMPEDEPIGFSNRGRKSAAQ